MDAEFFSTLYKTLRDMPIVANTLRGISLMAGLFYLVNVVKIYIQKINPENKDSYGYGLQDLAKSAVYLIIIIFSSEILYFFDAILFYLESQFEDPTLILSDLNIVIEDAEEDSTWQAMLYDLLVSASSHFASAIMAPVSAIIMTIGWLVDFMVYPLFLIERYFLLVVLQVFFPIVIALAALDIYRSMAEKFFKLYVAVYLILPGLFLVNTFLNIIKQNFTVDVIRGEYGKLLGTLFIELMDPVILIFFLILKIKLYKKVISFLFQMFT